MNLSSLESIFRNPHKDPYCHAYSALIAVWIVTLIQNPCSSPCNNPKSQSPKPLNPKALKALTTEAPETVEGPQVQILLRLLPLLSPRPKGPGHCYGGMLSRIAMTCS